MYQQGLNFLDYFPGLNFELNKEEILKNREEVQEEKQELDGNTLTLLLDLNEESVNLMLEDLKATYGLSLEESQKDRKQLAKLFLPECEYDGSEKVIFFSEKRKKGGK